MIAILILAYGSSLMAETSQPPVSFEVGGGALSRFSFDTYRLRGDVTTGHDGSVAGVDGSYGILAEARLIMLNRKLQLWLSPELTLLHHRYLSQDGTSQLGFLPAAGLGLTFGIGIEPSLKIQPLALGFGASLGLSRLTSDGRYVATIRPAAYFEMIINPGWADTVPRPAHRLGLKLTLGYNGWTTLVSEPEGILILLEAQGTGSDLSLFAGGFFASLSLVYRYALI